MHRTQPPARPTGTLRPAADLLRTVAQGYRDATLAWGRERLIDDEGRRCLVAAICQVADPTDVDAAGLPSFLRDPQARLVALTAMNAVAEHLMCDLGWKWSIEEDEPSEVDLIGDWQDHPHRTVLDVIRVCETVADSIRPATWAGAR